jgi:hypothetical protein
LSRRLAVYLAGLVGTAAIALFAASFAFHVDPRIAVQLDGDLRLETTTSPEIFTGIAFWILVTLVASALPVQPQRHGSR